jgi:hypothetical protein
VLCNEKRLEFLANACLTAVYEETGFIVANSPVYGPIFLMAIIQIQLAVADDRDMIFCLNPQEKPKPV